MKCLKGYIKPENENLFLFMLNPNSPNQPKYPCYGSNDSNGLLGEYVLTDHAAPFILYDWN